MTTEKMRERQNDREKEKSPIEIQTDRHTRKKERQKERKKERKKERIVCWLVGCVASQQYASVSQGRTCSDKFKFCYTETEVADQSFYLTQSQYTGKSDGGEGVGEGAKKERKRKEVEKKTVSLKRSFLAFVRCLTLEKLYPRRTRSKPEILTPTLAHAHA